MKSYYEIVEFQQQFLGIYKKCFGDQLWQNLYGVDSADFNLDNYINVCVLNIYPTVERLIVVNRKNQPILFAHLCKEENDCVIVGGLIPDLLNSGQGVFCSLIIFDYAFKQEQINSITVSILHENRRSIRMVKKLGFKGTHTSGTKGDLRQILTLHKINYPNHFSRRLLSRIEYAKM